MPARSNKKKPDEDGDDVAEIDFKDLNDSDKLNAIFVILNSMKDRLDTLEQVEGRVTEVERRLDRIEDLCGAKVGSFPAELSVIVSNLSLIHI